MFETTITSSNLTLLAEGCRPGREHVISMIGTFGTATLKLQIYAQGAWIDVPGASYTASAEAIRTNTNARNIRIIASGANGATSVVTSITEKQNS